MNYKDKYLKYKSKYYNLKYGDSSKFSITGAAVVAFMKQSGTTIIKDKYITNDNKEKN